MAGRWNKSRAMTEDLFTLSLQTLLQMADHVEIHGKQHEEHEEETDIITKINNPHTGIEGCHGLAPDDPEETVA